jgi:aconitate hydratase
MKSKGNNKTTIETPSGKYSIFSIQNIPGLPDNYVDRLPFSIRVLLEGVLRNINGDTITTKDVEYLATWHPIETVRKSIPFFPGRVVLQDFTGVPVMNDLAAMRAAMVKIGGDPLKVNPVIPVDLVIDHSVMVDVYAQSDALSQNAKFEFDRNQERYQFLRWSEKAFSNFRVIPPATGIIHQVNLEFLAQSVITKKIDNEIIAFPDSLIGTDSHTTMINGLGVVGWGVGGIEAVAAMMGQPLEILAPDVIGVRLNGTLPEGTTPTDLTLTIIETLRKKGVVNKFVEFFGTGLNSLSLADRAMISNMTPESGATMIYFPVDQKTLDYLRLTGKSDEHLQLIETYYRTQNMFLDSKTPEPEFSEIIDIDLGSIEPSLAGPKRPQDRVPLSQLQKNFRSNMIKSKSERGFGLSESVLEKESSIQIKNKEFKVKQGFLAIAAITSCTNTSNPFVMVAAGLLARKAVVRGLSVPSFVKTSFAPGSRVVTDYLKQSELMKPLEDLGFHIVGYGCTTCIGNSGPLPPEVIDVIENQNMVASAVLSGNRNFEGRVSPQTIANYLASPPLVVAFALAGTVDINLTSDPIGYDKNNNPVYLKEIWPTSSEIQAVLMSVVKPKLFTDSYKDVYFSNDTWNNIKVGEDTLYEWEKNSTYLQSPPFFNDLRTNQQIQSIKNARVLLKLGDSITTDHISPAGAIPAKSPAGQYLIEHGVPLAEFNSFGSRRGNDLVMSRGTFGNIRIKNLLLSGVEGGLTIYLPDGDQMPIYDAAWRYQQDGTPLVVLAGKEYGTGSSRDWAAKGPMLLGVKVVLAESFERIHRSNLVGMGVLPLEFLPDQNASSLNLDGTEIFTFTDIEPLQPGKLISVKAEKSNGTIIKFDARLRIDTLIEIKYFKDGGIMNSILLDLN